MVEGGAELVQLLLGDALAVTGQNLVLNLIDRPVHWGKNEMWFTIRRNHSFVFPRSSHPEGATLYLYQKSQKRGSNNKHNLIISLN